MVLMAVFDIISISKLPILNRKKIHVDFWNENRRLIVSVYC